VLINVGLPTPYNTILSLSYRIYSIHHPTVLGVILQLKTRERERERERRREKEGEEGEREIVQAKVLVFIVFSLRSSVFGLPPPLVSVVFILGGSVWALRQSLSAP